MVWTGIASAIVSVAVLFVCLTVVREDLMDELRTMLKRVCIAGAALHTLNVVFVWIMAYVQRNVPQTI